MSEMEAELSDSEMGRCRMCGTLLPTQEDLSKHLADAHSNDDFGNLLI